MLLAERCLLTSLGLPKPSRAVPIMHLFFPGNASSISSVAVPRLHLQQGSEELFRCLGQEANLSIRVEAVQVGRLGGQLSVDVLKPRATNLSPILCRVLCGHSTTPLAVDCCIFHWAQLLLVWFDFILFLHHTSSPQLPYKINVRLGWRKLSAWLQTEGFTFAPKRNWN